MTLVNSFKLLLIVSFLLLSGCVSSTRNYQKIHQAQNFYAQCDYSRSFKKLWDPAKSGDCRAQYAMGYMYYYGLGTDKNQDLGRSLIRRAANKNYIPAICAMKIISNVRYEQYQTFQTYPPRQPCCNNTEHLPCPYNWQRNKFNRCSP